MDNETINGKRKKTRHTLSWIIFIEVLLMGFGLLYIVSAFIDSGDKDLLYRDSDLEYFTEEEETEVQFFVPAPKIDEQLLSINPYSRPGKSIRRLDYIVIHYLANPKTTAQENRDYFESLKELRNESMSANYVVGLDGEVIHCIPDDEIAYASNRANDYSISIENCHKDDTGRFTTKTYNSLVELTAYLAEQYSIDRDHVIRHYDVTGKDCPKYFVDHPDRWEKFLDDVFEYQEKCREEYLASIEKEVETEDLELYHFLEENGKLDYTPETEFNGDITAIFRKG